MKFRTLVYGIFVFAIGTLVLWYLTIWEADTPAVGSDNTATSTSTYNTPNIRGSSTPVQTEPQNTKKKIAYAITITKDGPFLDGALVLGYSAMEAQKSSTKYTAELVAFVTPEVTHARPVLEEYGWKIVERDLPVSLEEIESEEYVKKVTCTLSHCMNCNKSCKNKICLADEGQRVLRCL
jgi:hypothetical protein